MPIVLVVDDSPTDQALIGGLLGREGQDWIVEYARDGNEALKMMDEVTPHVVITDMQMPGLDGMGLVAAVQERSPNIPVILVTGRGSEQLAVEALEGGAASYVSKSDLSRRLNETVKQALQLPEPGRGWQSLVDSFCDCEVSLSLENDPRLITSLVTLVRQMADAVNLCNATEQRHLGIAVDEALINSMYHGNLALPAAQLSKVRSELREGKKSELIEKRRLESPFADRHVNVNIRLDPKKISITLRDEGEGFDPGTIPDSGSSAMKQEGGRGIVLIRTFMNEVEFVENGKQITMVKYACNGET